MWFNRILLRPFSMHEESNLRSFHRLQYHSNQPSMYPTKVHNKSVWPLPRSNHIVAFLAHRHSYVYPDLVQDVRRLASSTASLHLAGYTSRTHAFLEVPSQAPAPPRQSSGTSSRRLGSTYLARSNRLDEVRPWPSWGKAGDSRRARAPPRRVRRQRSPRDVRPGRLLRLCGGMWDGCFSGGM